MHLLVGTMIVCMQNFLNIFFFPSNSWVLPAKGPENCYIPLLMSEANGRLFGKSTPDTTVLQLK